MTQLYEIRIYIQIKLFKLFKYARYMKYKTCLHGYKIVITTNKKNENWKNNSWEGSLRYELKNHSATSSRSSYVIILGLFQ